MPEKLLRTKDVAEILDVSPRQIRYLREEGDGPAFIRIRGSIRYRPEDVERYLERLAEESKSAS